MKHMIFVLLLLNAISGNRDALAQTLVLHLADSTTVSLELTSDFRMDYSGGKTVITLADGTTREFAQSDICSVTYSEVRGDVNRDKTVDVADIATVISIMTSEKPGDGGDTKPGNGDITTFTVNDVNFNMVYVEGGTFMMGSTASDADRDEKTVHEVTVGAFSIGQTEVTQDLWEAVMGSNPSNWKERGLPVESVSWYDCQTFIEELNRLTGLHFRLPTEAEWEFAARGGNSSKGYKYSGSDNVDSVAWYYINSDAKSHEVGMKLPNELGLYDMSGNVWEWCQDWYDSGYYTTAAMTDPTGPASGDYRVNRGGCWFYIARGCRSANRSANPPTDANDSLGLRLAM